MFTGAGTQAGDPVEANALGKFLKEASDPRTRYIGSVKTNVGHLESASGAIGVIKVLLMMKHDLIVPSLLWGEVNPQINLNELGLIIPRQPIKWKKEEKMACCNSFGFGGTNAHAVFQTHQLRHHKDKNTSRHESSIICFSGKSILSLKQSMEMMSEEEALLLNGSFKSVSEAEEHFLDISYTSTVRRDHHRFRKAFIVENIHDLIDNVSQCLAGGIVTKAASDPHIVFVFCGMGTAWPGMCLQMMDEFPSFREAIQEIDAHLKKFTKGQWSLIERFRKEDCSKDDLLSPIAIFACQVALVAVWKSLGVKPACVLGQSVGEVAAAYVAGCISLESAVAIIYFRSQILTQVSGGKMIVVKNMNVDKVRAALKDFKNANISLEYSPVSCAVSADPATMTKVRKKLSSISASDGSKVQVISLDVPVAYHSQFVDPCIPQLARALEKLQASPPTVQYISAVSGEELTVAPDQRYWTTHLREPVLFSKAVKTARKKNPGKTVFLEIGPRAVLKAHIHDIFPNEDVPVVISMSKQPEKKVFLQATASLYELGSDIQWEALFKTSHEITELPRYVFDKKTSLRRSEIQAMLLSGTPMVNHHLFLYPITVKTRDLFKIVLSTFTTSFVYDHIVGHTFVIPGALYLEAGFAIAKLVGNDLGNQALISATFVSPVSADKDDLIELDIKKADIPSLSKESSLQFDIVRNDRLVVTIKVDQLPPATCAPDQISLLHIKQKCKQLVGKDTIQTALRNLNFNFGESFSLLDHAFKGDRECLACIKPSTKVCQDFISTTIHPAVLDAMMQSSVVLMENSVKVEQQPLPEAVNKLKVFGKMEPCMYVHTRIESEENKRVRYSCVLYSTDGRTLAILDEYVVNKTNAESDCNLPMLMTMKWDPVSDSWDRDMAAENALILVTSSDTDMPRDDKMKMIGKSHNAREWTEIKIEMSELMKGAETYSACLVLCQTGITNGITCDELGTSLMNTCGIIQSVLSLAVDKKLTIPVIVCTFGAWPSPEGRSEVIVHPAASSLWGLVRTVQAEKVYSNVFIVDIQVPVNRMTSQFFSSMAGYFSSAYEHRENREYIITENKVFLNRISVIDKGTGVPLYREVNLDLNSNVVIMSQDINGVASPVAVKTDKAFRADASQIVVKPHLFALPSPHLLKMGMLLEESTVGPNKHPVFAVESIWQSAEKPQNLIVSCCPVHVATTVTVPSETAMETSAIPDYHPGDLTTLVLLFSLADKIKATDSTIIVPDTNKSLAQLMEMILKSRDSVASVHVMTSEDLHNTKVKSTALVSLVLLDDVIMGLLARQWENAKYLVTCKYLMTTAAHSHLVCHFANVEYEVVDTQNLFQPLIMRKIVPEVKHLLKNQDIKSLSEMADCLQSCRKMAAELRSDGVYRLLEFKEFSLQQLSLKVENKNLFDKNYLYIVVAGLTGLGWICVKYLAENGAGNIAILQRRSPSEDHIANITALSQSFHCNIEVFQTDITKFAQTQDALTNLQDRFPKARLKGIFFGAAVIDDGHFFSMTREKFEKALSPKVKGIWNLHVLTRDMPLDFFVMHSSIASVLGNQGQTNYCAGNAFLDGLAYFRRSLGLAAQSLSWGPLNVGLLSDKENVKQKLELSGYLLMSEQEIRDSLSPLLMLNWPHCSPLKLDEKRFARRLAGNSDHSLLARLQISLSLDEQTGGNEVTVDIHAAKSLDPERRQQTCSSYIANLACKILTITDRSLVTMDTSLVDLGFDSISSRMMIDQVYKDTGVELTLLPFVTGEATVRTLAEIVNKMIA